MQPNRSSMAEKGRRERRGPARSARAKSSSRFLAALCLRRPPRLGTSSAEGSSCAAKPLTSRSKYCATHASGSSAGTACAPRCHHSCAAPAMLSSSSDISSAHIGVLQRAHTQPVGNLGHCRCQPLCCQLDPCHQSSLRHRARVQVREQFADMPQGHQLIRMQIDAPSACRLGPYCTGASTPAGKLPHTDELTRRTTHLFHLMLSYYQPHLR